MTSGPILCLNVGSSSLKAGLYGVGTGDGDEPVVLAHTEVGWTCTPDPAGALAAVLETLGNDDRTAPGAVGHRIAHGGPGHVDHVVVDAGVLDDLRAATAFAPLHLPGELALIEAVEARWPGLAQVVCFDTSFHDTMPEVARRFPLPAWAYDAGIRRYGFHGLSCESVVHQIGDGQLSRAVITHLGNGASVTALVDGKSVDTTMGLTPTGGIVMGTRSGDLDPGVMIHLARQHRLDPEALAQVVDRQSGLLGLSGVSSDLRDLLSVEATDARAALAVEAFCTSVAKAIGGFAAVLGGVDTVVFTGGIGEHAATVRARICDRLGFLGVDLDPARNAVGAPVVSVDTGSCVVRVVPADENRMIARHTARLTGRG